MFRIKQNIIDTVNTSLLKSGFIALKILNVSLVEQAHNNSSFFPENVSFNIHNAHARHIDDMLKLNIMYVVHRNNRVKEIKEVATKTVYRRLHDNYDLNPSLLRQKCVSYAHCIHVCIMEMMKT